MPRPERCPAGGTDGSNPVPSSGESAANLTSSMGVPKILQAFSSVTRDTGTRFVARINIRAQSDPRSDIYVRRTYFGRPSSSIRFSEAAAMATSVICRLLVRERSASPITRL
jgi:hypothetical protein